MDKWTRTHVSDHCGFHHREFILEQLINRAKVPPDFKTLSQENASELIPLWQKELYFTERIILLYPGHETVWLHRRFLWKQFLNLSAFLLPSQREDSFDWQVDKETRMEEFHVDDYISPTTTEMPQNRVLPWPSLRIEIQFADLCISDDQVNNFKDQLRCASFYKLYVLDQVSYHLYPYHFLTFFVCSCYNSCNPTPISFQINLPDMNNSVHISEDM